MSCPNPHSDQQWPALQYKDSRGVLRTADVSAYIDVCNAEVTVKAVSGRSRWQATFGLRDGYIIFRTLWSMCVDGIRNIRLLP